MAYSGKYNLQVLLATVVQVQYYQRWQSYFLKVTRYLLLLCTYNKKYFVTVTYYLENEVTVITVLANEQHYSNLAKAFKLALQTLHMPM